MVFGKSQMSLPEMHGAANDSLVALPLRMTLPSLIAIVSPPTPTTRLMKDCLDCFGVALSHGVGVPSPALLSPHCEPPPWSSAPAGGWKTVMSPTFGSLPRIRLENRLTSTRS